MNWESCEDTLVLDPLGRIDRYEGISRRRRSGQPGITPGPGEIPFGAPTKKDINF